MASCVLAPASPKKTIAQPTAPRSVMQEGWAYRYSPRHEGRRTTTGDTYRDDAFTAAHRTLPLGARIRVTNQRNNRSVVVRVNDRGPYVPNRIIDLSGAAARFLELPRDGGLVLIELAEGSVDAQAQAAIDLEKERSVAADEEKTDDVEYTIQLGSFSDEQTARELAESIEGGWFYRIRVDDVWYYRVNFGVYLTRSEADQVREALLARGIDGFVKTVDEAERRTVIEN